MEITTLNPLAEDTQDKMLVTKHSYFVSLLAELRQRELPENVVGMINELVVAYNDYSGSEKGRRKQLYKSKNAVFRVLEKEVKVVPKNMYRTRWMAIGMSAFGVSMGAAFGAAMGNMAFIGLGIPIGLAIGLAVGTGMDNQAAKEGRQLTIPFK